MATNGDALLDRLGELIEAEVWQQSFILKRETWGRNRENRGFLLKFLRDRSLLRPASDATEEKKAIDLLRSINTAAHDGQSTPGLSRHKDMVAQQQGGNYCRICGSRSEPLHVDHITPASMAGGDELPNLQLLCARCNGGKSNMANGRLSSALVTTTTDKISDSLRYLRLSLTSREVNGRPMGRCDCGRTAEENPIEVQVAPEAAANLLSLRTRCERCGGIELNK